jgi:hypothetical protein
MYGLVVATASGGTKLTSVAVSFVPDVSHHLNTAFGT